MARIRTIKPEFWANDKLSSLSESAHLFAAALLNYCDDKGYFLANEKYLKNTLFPLRELSVSIHGILSELSNIGFLELKNGSDGRLYGRVTNFCDHQKINRPSSSKIQQLIQDSLRTHGGLTEDSLPERNLELGTWNLDQGTGNRDQGTGNREQGTGKTTLSGNFPTDALEKNSNKKRTTKKPGKQNGDATAAMVAEIISYLNEKTRSRFTIAECNAKLIRARIAEGATLESFFAVIDKKTTEWINHPKMRQFLRPATLFNAEKFNQYLGQLSMRTEADEWNDFLSDAPNGNDFIDIDAEVFRRDS